MGKGNSLLAMVSTEAGTGRNKRPFTYMIPNLINAYLIIHHT
jgi:hypothetical protein